MKSLALRRVLQDVRLHRIESVRRICEPPRCKILFDLAQKRVALGFACKLNCYTAFVVRRYRRRRAKVTATQSSQPRQRRPAQLINHGWPLLRGRRTKKITKPSPMTIK